MNNPEFEPDILKSIDVSGYSEKQTDLQIDKKDTGKQNTKQFNRQTKKSFQQNTTVVSLKKQKKTQVIFQAE